MYEASSDIVRLGIGCCTGECSEYLDVETSDRPRPLSGSRAEGGEVRLAKYVDNLCEARWLQVDGGGFGRGWLSSRKVVP